VNFNMDETLKATGEVWDGGKGRKVPGGAAKVRRGGGNSEDHKRKCAIRGTSA